MHIIVCPGLRAWYISTVHPETRLTSHQGVFTSFHGIVFNSAIYLHGCICSCMTLLHNRVHAVLCYDIMS